MIHDVVDCLNSSQVKLQAKGCHAFLLYFQGPIWPSVNYWKSNFSVSPWLAGGWVGLSYIISQEGGKLHFYNCFVGALGSMEKGEKSIGYLQIKTLFNLQRAFKYDFNSQIYSDVSYNNNIILYEFHNFHCSSRYNWKSENDLGNIKGIR